MAHILLLNKAKQFSHVLTLVFTGVTFFKKRNAIKLNEAMVKKASTSDKLKNVQAVSTSSLHQVIKTKAQGERFMKLLKQA